MLQSEIQTHGAADIRYEITSESGLDHDKSFHSAVFEGDKKLGEGVVKTKKEAEKMAAMMALEGFGCI
jgi:ribonuclease-3